VCRLGGNGGSGRESRRANLMYLKSKKQNFEINNKKYEKKNNLKIINHNSIKINTPKIKSTFEREKKIQNKPTHSTRLQFFE